MNSTGGKSLETPLTNEYEAKFTSTFLNEIRKTKGELRKEVEKGVLKILKDPEKGKPLRYIFQGCRTARVGT